MARFKKIYSIFGAMTVLAFPAITKASLYVTFGAAAFVPNNMPADKLSQLNTPGYTGAIIPSGDLSYSAPKMGSIYIGLGYNIMPNVRFEVGYIKPFLDNLTSSANSVPAQDSAGNNYAFSYNSNQKNKIDAIFSKVYVDLFELASLGKTYFSAGLGWSRINSNNTISYTLEDSAAATTATSSNTRTKTSNNLNWSIGAGMNIFSQQNIKADVGYEFQYFGKVAAYTANNLDYDLAYTQAKKIFKGHSIMLKLRIDV